MSNCNSCSKKLSIFTECIYDNDSYCKPCLKKKKEQEKDIKVKKETKEQDDYIKEDLVKHPLNLKKFFYKYFYWVLALAIMSALGSARTNNMVLSSPGGLGELFGSFIMSFILWCIVLGIIYLFYKLYWAIK
jgi:hypothetical protein